MYGLSSKILAVLLAGVMAWSVVVVCPCAKGECKAGREVVEQPVKKCCHKSDGQSRSGSDESGRGPTHRCANCVAASAANRPTVDDHAAALGLMPVVMLAVAAPVAGPLGAKVVLGVGEGVPIPPRLRDLFHSSCLLLV